MNEILYSNSIKMCAANVIIDNKVAKSRNYDVNDHHTFSKLKVQILTRKLDETIVVQDSKNRRIDIYYAEDISKDALQRLFEDERLSNLLGHNIFIHDLSQENRSYQQLHLCVGFYNDGSFKTNTVPDEDLEDNVKYNETFRPGRFYIIDGEYVCGGMLKEPFQSEYIEKCKQRIHELKLQPECYPTIPYV